MASAVVHLHRYNILHRDIACRNFVVSNKGEAVIIDFGLADFLPRADDGTYRSVLQLTPGVKLPFRWMPLEVFEKKETTKASDIYALGVSFWEFFNPRLTPFAECRNARSYVSMLRQVRDSPPLGEFQSAPLTGN